MNHGLEPFDAGAFVGVGFPQGPWASDSSGSGIFRKSDSSIFLEIRKQ